MAEEPTREMNLIQQEMRFWEREMKSKKKKMIKLKELKLCWTS